MVGDTVGDPFKDTTSVALNPIIKFSTLFGLLAVEIAISIKVDVAEKLARHESALDYTPLRWRGVAGGRAGLRLAFVLRDADSAARRGGGAEGTFDCRKSLLVADILPYPLANLRCETSALRFGA